MGEYPRMETIRTELLVKNAKNPNEQDERTFNALCRSIQDEGWVEPMATVVPNPDGTYAIVGGHHRYDAALVLGIEEGPCWVLDPEKFDQDRQNWAMVKVNIVKGKLNPAKFTALYNEMVKQYDEEVLQALMGFTDEDAFKALYKDVKRALPPALQDALAKQKDEIKTIDDLSLVLNRLFQEYGDTLDANYMVFSWAGKEVFWVRADDELWKQITQIADRARVRKMPVDEMLKEAFTAALNPAEVSTTQTSA
jgi:ParB-like chromosome segregation protein Spo0J